MDEKERIRDEEAAAEVADPNRLLPGEDPASADVDDARRWCEVYAELLDYKRTLLVVTEKKLTEMHDLPARREVVETDNVVIQAECARFERRLVFWKGRLESLDD